MHFSNDKWLITSTRMFHKMAVLHCISISELCSAINTTVATTHENFTSQHWIETIKFGRMQHMSFIAWNKRKIWTV